MSFLWGPLAAGRTALDDLKVVCGVPPHDVRVHERHLGHGINFADFWKGVAPNPLLPLLSRPAFSIFRRFFGIIWARFCNKRYLKSEDAFNSLGDGSG